MSVDDYQKAMAELGISRGGFEADAGIEGTPSGSQRRPTKQPVLLNPDASTVAVRPPMEEVDERFKCNYPANKTAKAWWSSLSPEDRKRHSLQRSENAKKQGKKAALT